MPAVGRAEHQPVRAGNHRVGAGGDLGEGSSLLIAVALLTHAHAAVLGLEGCQRILEAELQEKPSGSL